jgi:hypothetical protein
MGLEVVEEKDFVHVKFTGVLTREDLVEVGVVADRIERGRERIPHRLADLRAVNEVQIRYEDVRELADARRVLQFPNAFKSAILVANPVQSGMARMFRTLNDNPQIHLEVFEDEAAALAWLRS